ncbi:MAG: apolipoprotein N-acyltransferase [bacterium]|nr:apolipoprotein N-acyltransferase [bacterium]
MKASRKNRTRQPDKLADPARPVRRRFAADSVLAISLLVLATVLLKSVIFAPIAFWPVAFFCLVPWLVVVTTSSHPRRVYVSSFLMGFAFFLLNMFWMSYVTGAGYVVWAAFLAVSFPLMACPLRHWARRRRLPLALGLPIIWVGAEFVRGWILTGFPWFFLAHSQYRVLSLIQTSDLFGAYAVSFMIASVNGGLLDLLLPRLSSDDSTTDGVARALSRNRWIGAGTAALLLLATLGYSRFRLGQDTSAPGPRVAVIQGDYPLFVEMNRPRKSASEKAERYFEFMAHAAADQPDIFLLPETPWHMYLNREFIELDPETDGIDHRLNIAWSRRWSKLFQSWAEEMNATVVTGAFSLEPNPPGLRSGDLNYNSAFVYTPGGASAGRYDKCHRVVFGEYIPFRDGRLRFFYFWLHRFVPLAWLDGGKTHEYSLTPGEEFTIFTTSAPSLGGREYRFGVPICYEDVMPYVSREFTLGIDGGKRIDFLLNISNDGWFVHSNELPQHLAVGVFRAVENRVGIARAVNTGISGFIDPDGTIHDLVTDDRGRYHGPGIEGYAVASVKVDSRRTLYTRIGDVFALVCMVLWLLAYLDYFAVRALGRRHEEPTEEVNA